jgi:hypothetical protein
LQITEAGTNKLKDYIKRTVSYAEYQSSGVWYRIPIHSVTTLTDGRIAIYIMFDSSHKNIISAIRFYDTAGELWATGAESIDKTAFSEGILYRFAIKLIQS